jgi:hypothetical protein
MPPQFSQTGMAHTRWTPPCDPHAPPACPGFPHGTHALA